SAISKWTVGGNSKTRVSWAWRATNRRSFRPFRSWNSRATAPANEHGEMRRLEAAFGGEGMIASGDSERVLTNAHRKHVIPVAAALFLVTTSALADWPTHRGNPQRTGNIDGLPGPKAPKVLWVYKSQEHFVASPVVGNKELYLFGIGALNTAVLHALA